MTDMYTVARRHIPWYPASADRPLPLGRNVHHDSRSLAYPYRRVSNAPLVSVLHERCIPILDQGDVGDCTTNAGVGTLGTQPLYGTLPAGHAPLTEALAVSMYSDEEKLLYGTGYPPEDQGGDGLTTAKVMKARGLISGYVHCLSLEDVLHALQDGPVSIGVNWYDSFDNPPSSGLLTVSKGAQVRGGHEPMLRGVNPDSLEVFGDNSWSASWGLNGSFRMGWATLERLLGEEGDGTVSVPLTQPAPQPQPVPVPPVPSPPDPGTDPADMALATAVTSWAWDRHVGENRKAALATQGWLEAKGFVTPTQQG